MSRRDKAIFPLLKNLSADFNAFLLEKSWKDVQKNLGRFQNLFKQDFLIVDNSKHLEPEDATKKFNILVKKGIDKFVKKPIKNPIAKRWIKKQQILKKQGV